MAYIAQRGEFWRAEVRRRGYKPTYRTFDTKQQAQQWARRIESEIDCDAFVDRTAAKRTNLRGADFAAYKELRRASGRAENRQQRGSRQPSPYQHAP